MLGQHHEQFSQYWAWSDDYIQHAMQTGFVQTAFGWGYHIGIVGVVNERSLRNWPIQSAGADILEAQLHYGGAAQHQTVSADSRRGDDRGAD